MGNMILLSSQLHISFSWQAGTAQTSLKSPAVHGAQGREAASRMARPWMTKRVNESPGPRGGLMVGKVCRNLMKTAVCFCG